MDVSPCSTASCSLSPLAAAAVAPYYCRQHHGNCADEEGGCGRIVGKVLMVVVVVCVCMMMFLSLVFLFVRLFCEVAVYFFTVVRYGTCTNMYALRCVEEDII